MLKSVKLALCQIKVGSDKVLNIRNAAKAIDTTIPAKLVILPECWNSPYSTASFPTYAEHIPAIGDIPDPEISPSISMICQKAKDLDIWIVGGSIPEREGDKLYNTSVIVNANGEIIGKHRKIHLFDIDVPGKITFKESDSLSPGNTPTVFSSPWGMIGVGICYDIRFPEYAIWMRQLGAKIIIYPGAFNMVTGPAHWELLQRARAVDNQVYVATCSPARDETSGGYIAWGHSTVVSPWGEIVSKAGPGEETIFADLDLDNVETMRENIPCWKQKRTDLYVMSPK